MKMLFILLIILYSCKKADERRCWKFNGTNTELTVELESFEELEINPYLVVNLIQDSANFVVMKGGENVIKLVETKVNDNKLILSNTNKCKYLRNGKNKITVDLHFIGIKKIAYQGSENLKSIGVISSQVLNLDLKESSGNVELEINTDEFNLSAEPSWVNFTIAGNALNATISAKGNSYGDTRGLIVQDRLLCKSKTSGELFLNGATTLLKCETFGSGNVYYTNTPGNIEWNDYGAGKLLQAP